MPAPDLRDRCRGVLLGTAVGDALGAPFEGHRSVDTSALRAWADADEALRWTDDTHMTIGVAASLVACGGFDPQHMAARFVADHADEPWRGYGPGPPRVFAALRDGAAWDEPARRLHGGEGSFGNGAAMRVAPVGVAAHRDPLRAATIARDSARITHAHPVGQDGAAVQAVAVAWLLASTPPAEVATLPSLVDDLVAVAATDALRDKVALLPDLVSTGDPEQAAARLGTGLAADEAVPAALYAFGASGSGLAEAVLGAIALGGDTDTIAAMSGALAGALHGASSIPPPWLERLEARDRLVALADDLCVLAGGDV